MALDLDKLEKQLDEALAKETPETLRAYFMKKRTPNYKAIVDLAIGKKPSLVKKKQPEWLKDADKKFWNDFDTNMADHFKKPNKISGEQFVDEQIKKHLDDLASSPYPTDLYFKTPSDFFTKDLPTTTEPYEYKQQGFLPFANPPRFTEE